MASALVTYVRPSQFTNIAVYYIPILVPHKEQMAMYSVR